MQVLLTGIEYLLDTSDRSAQAKKTHVKFCHKDVEGRFVDGNMNEEIIKMMVDRYVYLVNKDSSTSNIRCLQFLRQALDCCTQRNTDKMKRKNHGGTGNGLPLQTGG
jgi:hypothetical protein